LLSTWRCTRYAWKSTEWAGVPERFRSTLEHEQHFRAVRRRLGDLPLLQILQPQFQLLNLPLHFLGLAPELHLPELAQQLQMLDLTLSAKQLSMSGNPFLVVGQQQRLRCDSIELTQICRVGP
jgi:hypothetical protein